MHVMRKYSDEPQGYAVFFSFKIHIVSLFLLSTYARDEKEQC